MHYSTVPLQIPLGLYHHHQRICNWPVEMWLENKYTVLKSVYKSTINSHHEQINEFQ